MVLRLGEDDVSRVVEVLSDAFAEYPVMRFVLGASRPRYADDLHRLVEFFVMARVHRREFVLGIADGDALQGVALVSQFPPGDMPAALHAHREALWRDLGADARRRYEAYGAASPIPVSRPHLHLNMIGVRRSAHGRGYARILLEHVHGLSRDDPGSAGVSLTTETPANLPLYRHFGYHIVGRQQVAPDLTTWGFFRRDRGSENLDEARIRPARVDERDALLAIWERSVRATHHFLAEHDIAGLRPHVAEALSGDAVPWWVMESSAGTPMGFLGFVDPSIEALFIDPEYFRQGAGRRLVEHAQRLATAPLRLDVNEQNPEAVRFYEAMGFAVTGGSPTDAAGRPFPLLHMQRRIAT